MSESRAEAPRPPAGPQPRGPFGGGGLGAAPPQKAKAFKPSARRLIGRLAPERTGVILVIALAVTSVLLSLSGPRLLGRATDLIFGAFLRGHEVDFDAVAHVLGGVAALYVGASIFAWLQGHLLNHVVQRSVRRLRADAQAKLDRLPLAYFDTQQRGELLSRVTNDIDNVAQSLQQTLSQILTGLLTVVGVVVMMIVISPLLALIALVTVPLSIVTTARIARRAQKRFVAQWAHVGKLNAQIEEAFTGHALIKVFGQRKEVEARFAAKNEELFETALEATFISSIIPPVRRGARTARTSCPPSCRRAASVRTAW